MPKGPRIVLDNVLYHIMTRGNQKQKVFIEESDFGEYLDRVRRYKRKYKFRLYGFCLMPNHIHLIGAVEDKENLAKFMHGINRSYTSYFNEKYHKVGHLWQGRFNSKIITMDPYAIDCMNYVELNPVRAEMVRMPSEYRWSSYRERNLGGNNDLLDSLEL
ncbi:MAG: transposase [Candidatus Omnitrophota bacterium]|nr:transposase [Candidatus Omnitrophota bacterium]